MSRDVCGICWCPYDDDGQCGCKPAQPEALRLADAFEKGVPGLGLIASAELRRLHAENEAAHAVGIWQERELMECEALLREVLEAMDDMATDSRLLDMSATRRHMFETARDALRGRLK